ncbi:MAG: hydantoinase B/oxoprolinase family protein [Nitriliruptor sp.]|uniref:hydantoinase B/oxoprolinase family protein n=1 Tax=Nitriliruptor sp. TaxID=2448056 RepID=UPI0034A0A606
MSAIDLIVLEIVQGTLASIEKEVEDAIGRTSRSPMIRDAHDYRAGIYDAGMRKLTGRSYSALVQPVVRDFPIDTMRPGDVYFHNDVYLSEGGIGHLPDLCVTVPVFARREDTEPAVDVATGEPVITDPQVVGFVQAFGHHDDIGGCVPGSMPSGATSVYEEGLMVPPIKLWDQGVPNQAALTIMTRNSRMPESLAGDLDAECSACLMGARRLGELFERYGVATVESCFDAIVSNNTDTYRREILPRIPDGTYVWEDYAEHDGVDEPKLHRQRITLTKEGGAGDDARLIIDFTGTSPQAKGPINHVADRADGNFLKKWLAPVLRNLAETPERMAELDVNEGIVDLIEMRFPPPGTLLTPIFPAPTNARTFVILRLLGVLSGVLAKAVDGDMPADQETIRYTGVYGTRADGTSYLMREVLGGGSGGRPHGDGEDTIHVVPDSRNLPTEFTESRFPFRVESLGLAQDSGGAGKHRGGLGYDKQIRMLEDAYFMSIADRSILSCWGVKGGKAGSPFRVTIDPGGPNEREMEGLVDDEPVKAGEVIRIRTTGGGGWGDPLERDVDAVLRDVAWGKVSITAADRDYGVVLTGDGSEVARSRHAEPPDDDATPRAEGIEVAPLDLDTLVVDHDATARRRDELREERGEVVAFFDRGPGYAQLDPEGRTHNDLDVL